MHTFFYSATPCFKFTQYFAKTHLEAASNNLSSPVDHWVPQRSFSPLGNKWFQFPFIGEPLLKQSVTFTKLHCVKVKEHPNHGFSRPWPLDLCEEVSGEVVELQRKNNRLTQLTSWCKIKLKHGADAVKAWLVIWGGCYKNMWKQGKPQLFVSDFFLPSLPKLPCACPNSIRECLKRQAKTNYQTSVRSFQKRTSFLGACAEVHKPHTMHRTTNQAMLPKLLIFLNFFYHRLQIADEKLTRLVFFHLCKSAFYILDSYSVYSGSPSPPE